MMTQHVTRRKTCDGAAVVAMAEQSADGNWGCRFYVDDLLICSKIMAGTSYEVAEHLNQLTAEIAATLEGPTLWTL